MKFTKNGLTGSLQLVTIDHCFKKGNKILWGVRQVLMLVDNQGFILSSAQFRSNAFKKAENFLISLGWSITE